MSAGIYAIVHVESGRTYVGSSNHIARRLSDHRQALAKGTHYNVLLQRFWTKYGADGFSMLTLEEVSDLSQLIAREQAHAEARKPNLFNVGDMVDCPWRGRPHSPEHRAKLGAARKGKPHPYTPEQRAKIIASNKARTGGTHSEATRQLMRAQRLGKPLKPWSDASKAKMREVGLRRTYSAATRQKMSESAKRRGRRAAEAAREAST